VICQAAAPIKTGSQATYVHRIQLFDEKGQLVNAKSKVPYSPKKTCGKCHDYERISTGWHFQAGLHETPEPNNAPGDGVGRLGEPFFLTHPAGGTQIPTSYRQWARRKGFSPADLGLNPFEFAQRFGAYCPGGGMLENTRDKTGKIQRLTGEPWDNTGVLEIDCLMCHLRTGYNPEMRASQIGYHNLKWAATAAAGFGVIRGEAAKAAESGEAAESSDPFERESQQAAGGGGVSVEVSYNPKTFDAGDFVTLDVTRRPPNSNCLFCHYTRTRPEPGGPDHHRVVDIHYEAGLYCTDCHKNDIDHKISRCDGSPADLANNPDNAHLTCQGCHRIGRAAAPKDDHPGLPAFHLEVISCTTCHSGPKPGPEVVAEQTAMAHRLGLSTEDDLSKRTSPAIWTAAPYRARPRVAIGLYRYLFPQWWGKKLDNRITPLPVSVVEAAMKQAGQAIKDDDKDGKPEVNTDGEITAVLGALAKGMGEKDGSAKPVFVARGGVYEVGGSGGVSWSVHEAGQPYRWAYAHPVRPARDSLGSGGCTDCHAGDAPFYFMALRTDAGDAGAASASTERTHQWLGAKESLVRLGGWREGSLKTCGLWIVPTMVVLCLLHYVTFGPKRIETGGSNDLIPRFDVLERWMHLFLMVSCILLAATGLGFLLAKLPYARGSFWTSHWALEVHEVCGFIFAAATVVTVLRWFVVALPVKYDWEWVKMLGGYLWIKGHPPAGKFNFGQKMLFWIAMGLAVILSATGITMWLHPGGDDGWATLAYSVHDVAALLLLAVLVAHIYLATIANPGTLISIFAGRVLRRWASFHHPNWVEEMDQTAGTSSPKH